MGQAASYNDEEFERDDVYDDDDDDDEDDDDEDDEEWSSDAEAEGYESEGSSVSLNDDGGGRPPHREPRSRFPHGSSRPSEEAGRRKRGATNDSDEPPSSPPPPPPPPPPPVDVESLSVDELKERIDSLQITREDILSAARAARKLHQHSIQTSSSPNATATAAAAASASDSSGAARTAAAAGGFYVDDTHYATDVKVAMRVLAASERVRNLRFRLVPARLKEPAFWGAVLGLLRYGRGGLCGILAGGEEGGASPSAGSGVGDSLGEGMAELDVAATSTARSEPGEGKNNLQQRAKSLQTASTAEVAELRRRLHQRDAELVQLRRNMDGMRDKVRVLERELGEARAANAKAAPSDADTPSAAAAAAAVTPAPHKGTWVMDRDSADFLALDAELKANLRSEKEKRLREVRSQMRFILDTDDASGSIGEWDCCGRKEFGGEGCA